MKHFCWMLFLCISVMIFGSDFSHGKAAADASLKEGNVKDALELYRKCLADPSCVGEEAGQCMVSASECLARLNRISEYDGLRESSVALRPADWRFVRRLWEHRPGSNGHVLGGRFQRGWSRGGGQWIDVEYADWLWFLQAYVNRMPADSDPQAAEYWLFLAEQLSEMADRKDAWVMMHLTELSTPPDYLNGAVQGSQIVGTPVDSEGKPVFFHAPASWEAAKNDGERFFWCISQAMKGRPAIAQRALNGLARFCDRLYGVGTLSRGYFQGWDRLRESGLDNPFSIQSLGDQETIALLATGVARFELPDDCNPIAILKRLEAMPNLDVKERVNCLMHLATLYEERMQYDMAVGYWRKLLAVQPEGNQGLAKERIKAITGNWCSMDLGEKPVAGKAADVWLTFRNGRRADLKVTRVDMEQVVADVQSAIQNMKQKKMEWWEMNFEDISRHLLDKKGAKYLKEEAASWSVDVEPAEGHRDRRISLQVPLLKAGYYMMTCKLADGANESRLFVHVTDTMLLVKKYNGRDGYCQVLDAVSGEPVAQAAVDFFIWRTHWNDKIKREESFCYRLAKKTDEQGMVRYSLEEDLKLDVRKYSYQMMVSAQKSGRCREWNRSGWGWWAVDREEESRQVRSFFMSDRPVYRPGQKVNFKFWLGRTSYDDDGPSSEAGKSKNVVIHDEKGKEVYTKTLTADEFGGISDEWDLPEDAALGVYYIGIRNSNHQGTFRVEEYRKPEYEVTVRTPDEAPMLGEKLPITVKASYYFGAPVTQGTARIKVTRETVDRQWWPVRPWDWFYGPGYWWFWSNSDWYPGWRRWGCSAPVWHWRQHFSHETPEVVADISQPLDADGSATVMVDTSLAKALLGDRDHRYRIEAAVVDPSRREVRGSGSVTVARRPFVATVWTHRGYANVGDKVTVEMSSQTLDGRPVPGKGILTLYRIEYDGKGTPAETPVKTWSVDADAEGHALQEISASEAGPFRLGWVVTDGRGRSEEGGVLLTVRGDKNDGRHFRYSGLELIPDKAEYAPGETVKLMIATEQANSTVMVMSTFQAAPRVIRLEGHQHILEIPITKKHMPNFHVEAYTACGGILHREVRQIAVPPEKKILNVTIEPDQVKAKPGSMNQAVVTLTDLQGKPYQGSVVVSVYDKSVEAISGGSNVGDIKSAFWSWTRRYGLLPLVTQIWHERLYKEGDQVMEMLGSRWGHIDDVVVQVASNAGGHRRERVAMFSKAMAPANMDGMVAETDMAMAMGAADESGSDSSVAVRTNFADTACWVGAMTTDEQGKATVAIPMPENLTTWKMRVWAKGRLGMTVGEASAELLTSKDLIVRLETPRFLVEKDCCVLSAIVHNYLETEKKVRVALNLDGGCLSTAEPLARLVTIPAGGASRVDWLTYAVAAGEAVAQVRAVADCESDGMEMRFPVMVHGVDKQIPFSRMMKADEEETSMEVDIPEDSRPETRNMEVRWSPSLALAMLDAVPYLLDSPVGSTDQTLNRFLPALQVRSTLEQAGVNLEQLKQEHSNLNAQELGDAAERREQWKRWDHGPIFDSQTLDRIIRKGLEDLLKMQCGDGGWGWFSGWGEHSWPHTTAQVVRGLCRAKKLGVPVPEHALKQGVNWLNGYQKRRVSEISGGTVLSSNLDALVYAVLAECGETQKEMEQLLMRDKATSLSPMGLAMLGLGLQAGKKTAELKAVMKNLEQYLIIDDENQTAFMNLKGGCWWYWYGDEFETQATTLKLLVRTGDPQGVAPRLVKYLLNNRKHGSRWNSTRDTAACLDAFSEYLKASGEGKADLTVEVLVDGKAVKASVITPENLFQAELSCVIDASKLAPGPHTVTVRKRGNAPLYINGYVSYFSTEGQIRHEGLEVKVERRICKLVPETIQMAAADSRGQAMTQRYDRYRKVLLHPGEVIKSGDLLEVELIVDSKNDYEYLLLEDRKAAGTEAEGAQSGYNGNALGAYAEFHDDRVSFFLHHLPRGTRSLTYRLRAELPGRFSALPTTVSGVYAPELRGNADEAKVDIED